MTYRELKAILAGVHAWAKTPLEFFENAPEHREVLDRASARQATPGRRRRRQLRRHDSGAVMPSHQQTRAQHLIFGVAGELCERENATSVPLLDVPGSPSSARDRSPDAVLAGNSNRRADRAG